jgi:hypothetical protein
VPVTGRGHCPPQADSWMAHLCSSYEKAKPVNMRALKNYPQLKTASLSSDFIGKGSLFLLYNRYNNSWWCPK